MRLFASLKVLDILIGQMVVFRPVIRAIDLATVQPRRVVGGGDS